MSKLSGIHTCTCCKEKYLWDYQIPQPHTSNFIPYEIDNACVHAVRLNSPKSNVFELKLKCKYCGHFDVFTYDNKKSKNQ